MNRSPGTTITRIGGRLVAVLLPLAALALLRAFPALDRPTLPSVALAVAASAALLAGAALLAAVAVALERGRIRDLADLAGLGLIATSFAVVALDAAGTLGLAIGVTSAAAAFNVGAAVRQRAVVSRRGRIAGPVIAFVLVEAGLAGILTAGGWSIPERTATLFLAGGALLMTAAAIGSLDDPTRATALGIAASSAGALAIAPPSGFESLVGPAGMGLAALVLGSRMLADRRQGRATAEPAGTLPELPARADSPPESNEPVRLTRELRATLDDLVAARHLIELQRIEIDRATSTDALTGLPSRWPTLDRLRTEAAEARRYAHPFAAVLIDVDQFAALNHEQGLEVGDEMLRRIALRLRVRMREADAVGRVGADAFLAILPHTDEVGAATFARAVLDRVLERRVMTVRGELTVSLSIGIALMRPGMTLTGDELLAAAEEALASAQAAGGNRIAFDRLHGLARIDELDAAPETSLRDVAEGTA
ncbi:MAG: GGDEF domain-containing protein [Chloroflexi bacterium]|nr:GGDEF domain-containing protein [Chloroflexota bacterium]